MCKSPASPEIPTRGHAHGAVEKGERSEQGLCGKIGRKAVNRKLLHIAQGVCRKFGAWKRPCRGRAVPSRRNACGKNRVALKWGRFQICHCEGALRPWQSREGTADSERLSSKWHAPPFRVIPRSEASLALPRGELSPKVTERVLQALLNGNSNQGEGCFSLSGGCAASSPKGRAKLRNDKLGG